MKFENLSLKNQTLLEKAKRAKRHLWRGYPDRAIIRLEEIKNHLQEKQEQRQQHMKWSRKGLHSLLQVRASISSNSGQQHWERYAGEAMLKTAA
ncbi:hypothetical protein FM037_08920 [Shewanella psychropiezotolerans]|uniref:Uncharacterized protein n=1 Tax=Shewanella psychropiezotolerans TaxID=2593655 RepID=A0ABX5WX11_9GAMM|nr:MULTISPECIES: hypothetical protein [Shewanella]MPY22337.1 hypothetical protein [Shewanella sp. YLB-07]QDO83326.1 hypothetical protein FM037_08920 [Shewanella psychropiezotolerans]